ncbi:MAG: aldo/keto reductase, partial [Armatimonadia bacterium]
MQYREVGDTGIKVSVLGHGTMRYKGAENAAEMIQHGLSLGLNYFDCGTAYGFKSPEDNAEAWVGAAIAGVPREQMVLSAKAQPRLGEEKRERGLGINTRDGMWQCIEGSLKRLGVQSLDFYQFWDMSSATDFEAACRDGKDAPLQAVREAR